MQEFGCREARTGGPRWRRLALAEAYYIERHDPEDLYGGSLGPWEDGIRNHESAGGFGAPMAGWCFGPFFRLLNLRPFETIALINRMLDHAAAARVGRNDPWSSREAPDSPLPGIELDLPGIGARHCVGDGHVWLWYRGSSVGPYPCMSALLAVERFADHLVDNIGVPLGMVVEMLLRGCNNLAMPGLVVGILVRHLERVGILLDPWLNQPELWHLEFARVVAESGLHVQGPDASELVGRDRRGFSFRDAAAQITLRAMVAGDEERLASLAEVADELVQRARELVADAGGPGELATVEGWAATLRPESYQTREADGGGLIIEYVAPPDVASALAPSLEALARGNDAARLVVAYGQSPDRIAPVDTLLDDLNVARALAVDPPVRSALDPMDSIAAVSAAVIVAHSQGRAVVPEADIIWCADVLVAAATDPRLDAFSYNETVFPMAADRSASAGLPALFLPTFRGVDLDFARIGEALQACATSLFDEVTGALALGLEPVWGMPCYQPEGSGLCLHEVAWAAVQEGLRDCRLGDWDQERQRRLPDPLPGRYAKTLLTVETERLLLNRLVPPLVAAAHAARSQACVAGDARLLLHVLLDAHRRSSDHWATEGYGSYGPLRNRESPSVVRVLVESLVEGEAEPLIEHVRAFSSNPRTLDQLLHALAILLTYDESLRDELTVVWRTVLSTALDAGAGLRGDRHWSDDAIARLLPTPQLELDDTDPDATFERARRAWLDPDDIIDLITRWIPFAQGEPKALNPMVACHAGVLHRASCAIESKNPTRYAT